MPSIPIYNARQVDEEQTRMPMASTPDVSSGARAVAGGLAKASDAMTAVAERDAQTQAWDTQAKINQDYVAWEAGARKAAQGANAKGYSAAVAAWWEEAKTKYAEGVTPMAQRLISRQLAAARNTSLESALGYENQQLDIGERSALEANISALTNQAITAGPDKARVYTDQAAEALRAYGAKKGLDPAPGVLKMTTGVHENIINHLMQTDAKAAQTYFTNHADEIEASRHDAITEKLNHVSAVQDGSNTADELWQQNVKGKDFNQPVNLFEMEAAARKQYANDPTRAQATISALRERKAAWDATQNEFNASNVNGVYAMLDSGTPMSKVQATPAWQALPAVERDKIMYQREAREAAREQRAAAAEGRALAAEQRKDRMLLMTNADKYLEATDPTKLSAMSRTQVQALRSTFGFAATEQLLNRYDNLIKSPHDLTEAKMDDDSFKRIASDFELNAYQPRSQLEKEQLGDLKYRVERLIAAAQTKKGGKLGEDEKEQLMRDEMARTVKVDPGWLSSNKDVPVIRLQGDQVQQVIVPDDERAKIVTALQTKYKQNPNNPLYAPTPENVRRLYLLAKSRSAPLIPPAKQ